MAVVLAGGGLKRGYVHGATDTRHGPGGRTVHAGRRGGDDLPPLGHRPAFELQSPTGRPIQLSARAR